MAGSVLFDRLRRRLFLVAVDLLEQAGFFGRRLVFFLAAARSLGLLALAGLQAAHETIDLPGGVHDALLTGVERVAVRADVHAQVLPGRMRRPDCAAGAARNRRLETLGVNIRLHDPPPQAALSTASAAGLA